MGCVADKPIPETKGGFSAPRPLPSPHFPVTPAEDFQANFQANLQANFKLIEAIKKCDIILLKKVLERYQINPTQLVGPSQQGKTVLHKLAEHNFSEGMAHFLDELASQKSGHASRILNMKDGDGNTPLLLCCLANAVETLEVLAHSEHIDIQAQNFAKKTALEVAMEMESSCVSILAALTAGSDPTTKATIKSSIEGSQQFQSLEEASKGLQNERDDDANSDDNNTRTSLESKSPTLPATKAPKDVKELQEISLEDMKDRLSQIIANLKANKTHFVDHEFPHEIGCLEEESEGTLMAKYPKLKWMRASNFLGFVPDTLTIFEHFEPNVATRTPLAGCQIYSAFAAMAEFPQRLYKIFNTKDVSQHGIYSVTLNVSGMPVEILLDDFFPSSDGDQFLYSRSISNELWFSLLEKAFAKLHGGYYGLEQIGITEALESLTGMPVIHKPMKHPEHDKLWAKLMDYDKKNYIICAGETKRHYNSFRNRIYTVIHVFEAENYKIVKLRNHFDDYEWQGDFSHKSELWTEKLKEEVGYCAADPTCFYMELKDFIAEFDSLTVCHYHDKWIHNRVNVNCQPNSATYFELKVEKEMDAYLSVHQKDPKFVDDEDYNYSPVEVILAKDLDGTALESIAFGERDAFLGKPAVYIHENHKVKLQPGRYLIYAKVRWVDNNMHDFFLNVLSSQPAQVGIISQPVNLDFLEQVYLNTGMISNTKFNMANDCQFASGWSGSHLWMYASNKTNKTWCLEITFDKLINLKLGKKHRDQPKTIKFVIPPNQKAAAYAKRMNPGAVSVGWNFSQKWE